MKYYLFNAENNDFIMKCTAEELECFKKAYKCKVEEVYDTGCDAFGNEFTYISVYVTF